MTTATTTSIASRDVRAASRAALASGARAMAPWLTGIVPFGLVIGVRAAQADAPLLATWMAGPLLFGGGAHAALVQMLDAGTSASVIVATTLAINARLVLYSATMARPWRDLPRPWRALFAYVLVEPTFAVAVDGYEHIAERRRAHLHYAGAGATLWVAWIGAISIGATAGTALPSSLRLEMVIPLFLAGEVAHRVRDRATASAAVVAAAVAVAASPLPLGVAPLSALLCGVVAGVLTERNPRRTS